MQRVWVWSLVGLIKIPHALRCSQKKKKMKGRKTERERKEKRKEEQKVGERKMERVTPINPEDQSWWENLTGIETGKSSHLTNIQNTHAPQFHPHLGHHPEPEISKMVLESKAFPTTPPEEAKTQITQPWKCLIFLYQAEVIDYVETGTWKDVTPDSDDDGDNSNHNRQHFLGASSTPGTVLCALHTLFHSTLATACKGGADIRPIQFSSVQSLSHVRLIATPWTAASQASLSIINSQSLLKLTSIESVMPSNHLILCWPRLLLPSMFPSIRVFSNESVLCIRWPKFWSFSFNISLSNEYSGLISFRMDWLDLLAVQGTLKSLLQHHSSKASILWCSAFFVAQLSHPYTTTGETIALTRQNFADKVMSLFFMLSRLVITFLPRSKCLLISWLQPPSAVILEPQKINLSLFPLFTHLFAMKRWDRMPWS